MSSQPTKTATDAVEQQSLWITHVSAVGPYLKVCGQLNPMIDLPQRLKENVLPKCQVMHSSWSNAQKKQHLSAERIYLVKSINRITSLGDSELLRARMLRLIETQPPQAVLLVEVDFIDMGYSKIIECEELLIAPQDNKLLSMPALGSQFIMLGIFADWTPLELEDILRFIARQSLSINVEMEIQGYKFIKLKWKDWDFGEFLVSQRKIGSPINKDFQRDNFLRVLKEHQQDSINTTNSSNHHNNNNNTRKHNNNLDYGSKQNTYDKDNGKGPRPLLGRNVTTRMEEANAIKQQFQQQQLQQQQQFIQQQLLQQQMQQAFLPGMIVPNVPRLPRNMANDLQSYMMGIHQQNNRMPYTGQSLANPMFASLNALHKPLAPTALRLQRPLAGPSSPTKTPSSPVHNNNIMNNKSGKSLPNTGYKINKFTVGSNYDVCVSFVEKGPYIFSVQLISAQQQLTDMMNRIERIRLQNLSDKLSVGMACIARYSEDGQLYRALVVNAQGSDAQVIYVDYGNSEFVKKNDLYEIPADFLEERAYAVPFALAGLKALGPIDDSLKKAFKEMVVYKNCMLKVTPPEGPPVVQYCELYLQDKNILHVLQDIQKSRLVYPKAAQLLNNDVVEIRFIDSPRNFYVQCIANITEFEQLMDDMFYHYNSNQVVPQHIAVGAAYAVKTDADWYRAEIIRADEQAIIVRLVDFGYERTVTKNLLSTIAEKHLKMPRQAVHCCLKGFESNELNNKDIATTQFEMLAEDSNGPRRSFNVKVFRIQPDDLHIVNLFTKELNVMKKLYKLSMPFEQYLTLEKEDFHMNGYGTNNGTQIKRKSKDDNSKAHSTSSSNVGDEQSSQRSKKSVKENEKVKIAIPPTTAQNQTQKLPLNYGQQTMQQQSKPIQTRQIMVNSTPAQRLQQFSSKDLNKSSEWEKISTASSSNTRDARSNASDRQKIPQQQRTHQQNNQQQQGRKQNQDLLNNSFESTDRRSDASSNSNRTRATNAQRQKERRHNKEVVGATQKSPRSQKQQQERSQNAPQGYSQSRRGSMDSEYGFEISVNNAAVPMAMPTRPEEYMPLNSGFPQAAIALPCTEEVTICWWISPHQFFTHRKSRAAAFADIMRDIQSFYKKKPLQQLQLKPESYVIARHRKDNMLYRARIVACNHMLRKYKVNFVDFGSQYTVTSEDIWPVERRFADFPIMAYYCSLSNIISNYDHLYIIDRMDKYLPNGATLICDFKEQGAKDLYYVNIKVNNVSLLERLKNDGFVTEISADIDIELLAGQQIRAKIVTIKNMLNFKIVIEGCDAPLLCSYDDVRFVKSNPDIVHKFKQFYEGKSCMVHIKDVNEHKVVLLRPLLPLFKEETSTYICNYPRIWRSFKGFVVFISSAHRLFVHPQFMEEKIAKLLDDMFEYYETKGSPLTSYEIGKICAAKSTADSNWYRARILKPNNGNGFEVYYIDYGNTELLEKTQLKVLEQQFYEGQSAYAIEVNLPMRPILAAKTNSKKLNTVEVNAAVMEQLRIFLDEQVITIQAVECRRNHLIGEVLTENGQNMLNVLIEQKLVKGRDLEYMCKQLENDKSNVFEFIETVDLTLDDEDESNAERRQQNKSQKVTSPRKKKNNNNNISKEEIEKKPVEVVKVQEMPVDESRVKQNTSIPTAKELTKNTEPKPAPAEAVAPEILLPTTEVKDTNQPVKPTEPITVVVVEDTKVTEETTESVSVSAAESPVQPASLEDYSDMEQAVLSHCDTPAQFFVHTHDKIEQLRKLQENLQIVASSFPPLMNVYNGAYCISNYSVDKQWYRSQIIDAELMAIKFIDFGNTDCVSDTIDVKEMSVFPDIEPLCIQCALPIRPNGTADWVDAANAVFNESYSKTLYFNYIIRGDQKKPSYINLYIEGVNIAEKLINDGFAKPLELVDSGVNCFISHVNCLTDFYIQYEKDSKALELIEIYLSDTEKLEKITAFTKHKIVAALFHDDGMWYRAKLLNQLPAGQGFEVLFIDYGNTAVTEECRAISEEIANLPPLSKKCALDLSNEEFIGWSDAAEAKFAEIAASGETIFNVELRAPAADHALVHLYIDNLNINSELEPLCIRRNIEETKTTDLNASFGAQSVATIDTSDSSQIYNGVISHSISPACFFVQFEKDSARLEDLLNTLNASVGMDTVKENVEIGKLYATVYDDDNKLYRARVLQIDEENEVKSYTVLFVDYGNEAVVTELRLLPHDLEQMREFSKCCALNGLDALNAQSDVATVTEAFHALIDLSEGVVKLDFEQPQPEKGAAIVNLYTPNSNESIYEQILVKMHEKKLASATKAASNQCLISHAATPYEFYIQLQTNLTKLETITNSLRQTNESVLRKLTAEPKLNDLYAVFSLEDSCYYRGRLTAIVEQPPSSYEVQLIDHGNSIKATDLRELPEELHAEPAIAVRCRLSELPTEHEANQTLATECFTSLVDAHFGEFFEFETIATNNVELEVKLKIDNKDLGAQLSEALKSGVIPQTAVEPTLHDCAIVHINSTSSFYIQLLENTPEIEKITDTLLDAETEFDIFTDVEVGALCAAQFPDDGVFYRARILTILEEGNKDANINSQCLVHFIDFGNDSVTDQLRILPENMLNQPNYSKHCALDTKFKEAEAATTHFQAYIDEHYSETFQLEFVSQANEDDEPTLCRLFHQTKNVATELQMLLKNA